MALAGFLGGIGGGATVAIIIRAYDQYSSQFKQAQKQTGLLGKAIGKFGVIGTAAFAAVGIATVGFIKSATQQAIAYERTKIAFEVMLGSAKKSKEFLADLANFSKRTPFTITDLEENSRLLLGMGIEADKVIETMKSLGDVSAGLNVPIERLALNFGQVKAQGRLLGTELRDFARAGVPIIAELASNLDVTEASIKELASKGKISFQMVEDAFKSMTSEGGKFANLMARSMDTTSGKISNMKDEWIKFQRIFGEAFAPTVGKIAQAAGNLVGYLGGMLNFAKEQGIWQKRVNAELKAGTFTLQDYTEAMKKSGNNYKDAAIYLDIYGSYLEREAELKEELAEITALSSEMMINDAAMLAQEYVNLANMENLDNKAKLDNIIRMGQIKEAIAAMDPQYQQLFNNLEKEYSAIEKVNGSLMKQISLKSALMEKGFGSRDLSNTLLNDAERAAVESGQKVFLKGGGTARKVGDAILRPNGDVIETDPRDTIIATKSGMGGIVIENIYVSGIDADSVAEALQSKLAAMIKT